MIGLCGAHRTGKTSLARAVAEKHEDVLFLETPVSGICKELGFDPARTHDFKTRLEVQGEILKRVDAIYAKHAGERAITDRTPLDMIAYTMADAIGDRVAQEDQQRFASYVQQCIDVTNKRFGVLIVVQPGIPLVPAEGKAALNAAYIEHLSAIILGLSVDERVKPLHFYLPRSMTDMVERVGAVEFAMGRAEKRAQEQIEREVAGGYRLM